MSNRTTWLIAAIASLTLLAGVAIAQIGPAGSSITTSTTSTAIDDNGGLRPDGVSDDTPGDISGNCDEAEHANDPECIGGGNTDGGPDDNSTDDNSGSSGSGSDDSSGHGGSDDSGSGGSGSDDSSND